MINECSIFQLMGKIFARLWCCLTHRQHRKTIGGWDGAFKKYADHECQKCGRIYRDVVIGVYDTGLK